MFASGRRTVTTWWRAGGLQDDYRGYYDFLQKVGQRWLSLGDRVLQLVLKRVLKDESRVLLVIDDTPTKRYGPQVAGAGIHHDPTPGPTGNEFCDGHVWVTLAVCVRHALWGAIGLPIWSWLYVRKVDVEKLSPESRWTFQTKLVQAAELVLRAARRIQAAGKSVWAVADGAYAARPFVRPLMEAGITVVGRLRKDAALYDVPPVVQNPGRGRPRQYGVNRLSRRSAPLIPKAGPR